MIATEAPAYSDTPLTRAERARARACKAIAHYQQLIADGWLTARELDRARCEMVRAAWRKVRAEAKMEEGQP